MTEQLALAMHHCRGCDAELEYRGYGRPPLWCDECLPPRYPTRPAGTVTKVTRGVSGGLRRSDPATSDNAARSQRGSAEAAIRAFFAAHPGSYTDDEIAERLPQFYGPTLKSARSRIRELVPSGEMRASARGRTAICWKWRT